ncbi:MAG: galactose oxidase, partial [Candidatus Rokubacteria bacterium]|nr:galactose oxidase [Candidatus Rokubacteria bacterium]
MRRPAWRSRVGLALLLAGLAVTPSRAEAQGRWTTAAPMPEARTEVAVAEVSGKIYVVGGFGGSGALLEYDPGTDRWRERARPPRALHHATAAEVGGRLYVIGGYTAGWTPVDT